MWINFQTFLKRFYLFIFTQTKRREKDKERNINVCPPLMGPSPAPHQQPRHTPRPGIELVTDPPVRELALNPPSHRSPSSNIFFKGEITSGSITYIRCRRQIPLSVTYLLKLHFNLLLVVIKTTF